LKASISKATEEERNSEGVRDFLQLLITTIATPNVVIDKFIDSKMFNLFFKNNQNNINQILAKHNLIMENVNDLITISNANFKLDEHNFIKPRKSIPIIDIPTNDPSPITTENRFQSLDSEAMEDTPTQQEIIIENPTSDNNKQSQPAPKIRKQFQIFIEITESNKDILKLIYEISPNFTSKLIRNEIQLLTNDATAFHSVQNFLKNHNIPTRFLNTKAIKPKKFILKNLPAYTPREEIEAI
jgi:hypothetical protein